MCGRRLDGRTCRKRDDHLCVPRADHAVAFCHEICVHTKDRWTRQPFILSPWQHDDIVRPLFGEVRWDDEATCYVRRFRIGWIELARKNGKSELLAFVALYILCGDGVESAEVYGRFWTAMRTGMGTRLEPLLLAATTAGDDPTRSRRPSTPSA